MKGSRYILLFWMSVASAMDTYEPEHLHVKEHMTPDYDLLLKQVQETFEPLQKELEPLGNGHLSEAIKNIEKIRHEHAQDLEEHMDADTVAAAQALVQDSYRNKVIQAILNQI